MDVFFEKRKFYKADVQMKKKILIIMSALELLIQKKVLMTKQSNIPLILSLVIIAENLNTMMAHYMYHHWD